MTHIYLSEALAIKSRFATGVLQKPGVIGVYVGSRMFDGRPTGEFIIHVWVESAGSAPSLPDCVEGIPVDIVEVRNVHE